MPPLEVAVHSKPANALISWILTSVVALAALESFRTDALLWGGFAIFVIAIIAVPAISTREWTVMIPWPLLLVLAVAIIGRALGVYPEIVGYLTIAALALVVIVELDAFTPVDMSRRFVVGFAGLTTLAFQGFWIVAQYYSDQWLGTEFLRSQTELQWDIVIVTVTGVFLHGIFVWYFERTEHVGSHEHQIVPSQSS